MSPACENPRVQHDHRQVSGSFNIVGDTDDLFYCYDAASNGCASAAEKDIATCSNKTKPAGSIGWPTTTAAGARSSPFVAEHNRLYLAVPHRGAQKAEIHIYEAR